MRVGWTLGAIVVGCATVGSVLADDSPQIIPRMYLELDRWEFQVEGTADGTWTPAKVPSAFEEMAGQSFDGVGLYRTSLPRSLSDQMRAFLRFDAVATEAVVTCDGVEVARHLGGWTPFRCEITKWVRPSKDKEDPVEIVVRVDEKVGHNTQGFLPIVQPHFGGIWQKVRLELVRESHLDDTRILAVGDLPSGKVRVEAPIVGANNAKVALSYRRLGDQEWSSEALGQANGPFFQAELPIPEPRAWSPQSPALYELRLRLPDSGDEVISRFAFRSIETKGNGLRLNGLPLQVRGLLNWGYYPPRLAPTPDEARFLRDVKFAKENGFNLMKFCLWMPPKRYLEICDEQGMLAWVEYPTWHPKLDEQHRQELEAEFQEFFAFDRNHPSVILRSLTCETGTSSDLRVIQSLYDSCKAMIPGAIVEDDSSWIEWQRIFDFYDDHPYGNNHTWVATLNRLKAYIHAHQPKPLVLGEAIAADTWPALSRLSAEVRDERPYWLPGFLDAALAWTERIRELYGPVGLDQLTPDSLRYAAKMRKYQIETYRREVPEGGYVVSVIRDFPLAAMGLLGFGDEVKWPDAQLYRSQRDIQLLISTPSDRFAFAPGSSLPGDVAFHLSYFGDPNLRLARLKVALPLPGQEPFENQDGTVALKVGALQRDLIQRDLVKAPPVDAPRRAALIARLEIAPGEPPIAENSWPIWLLPVPETPEVRWHESVGDDLASLLPTGRPIKENETPDGPPIVTRRLDEHLLSLLEQGADVLVLPDGQPGSFATANHWFLRGGPLLPSHPLLTRVPRDLLVDLQHFDLAGPVIPNIDSYLDQIDPVMLLWDNHDLKEVRTHALAFETKAGKGRLFVSAFNHGPIDNAAGRWLLGEMVRHLQGGPVPIRALADETIQRIRAKIRDRSIDLSRNPWRFRPDPENNGLANGWQKPETQAGQGWTDLRIDRHWESQGFETLDGWAWYRITVDVPADWKGEKLYLSFRGADDAYELYANGQLAGTGGDILNKKTAFDDRTSHDVTGFARSGEPLTIAVRIYDWYGAGGLFRPVSLGTSPIGPEADWIR